ncbi:MAG: MoaD/ThiS family protein [Methyloversatilis discipulorum]|uniref:MoaD/ThiS family protein n=1 Tax=Methyloversatilis discipulorum TaxID=1119528 RepID=UPI0026EC4992|nr:MoaD/ThiS family protein [Methyloversatilis discipulorum]MBT9516428.1 MoaD/ThiS family protein [Methyloversatilis discipulorum]
MKVLIPSALRSYTDSAHAEVDGATLAEVVAALDLQYPGIAFRMIDEQGRIRRHIRFFVDGQQVRDLAQAADADGELVIVQALSGG